GTGDSGTISAHLGHDVPGFPSVGMSWPTGLNPARTAPSTCPRSRTTGSRRHNTVASARVRASTRLTRKPADQPDLGATASRVPTRRSGTDRVGARLSTRASRSWPPASPGYGSKDEPPTDRYIYASALSGRMSASAASRSLTHGSADRTTWRT